MDARQSRSASPPPPGPAPIRRLEESLINRIAAGEIIHRPSSALKELLENALDAGATSIRITVKDGGMKLLQIQDNGSGIRKADLPLLATRFATSKLSKFSDLSQLQTYGFRGEALASISYVAHLSVITKTRQDSCAWKAHYSEGVLTPPKPGFSADPKACAGNDGTTITVENMFYNTPTRLAALRSTSEEYARILDVVTRYAVHNPMVAFVCKKAGSANPDVSTPQGSTVPQTIGLLYGSAVRKELIEVNTGSSPSTENKSDDVDPDEDMENYQKDTSEAKDAWTAEAQITGPNYQARKFTFLLFINHRLVESARMKRAIEAAFVGSLPKSACPFVYLSLLLPPHTVDVNVHPTKREVHFLDEEAIIEKIADAMQTVLVRGEGAKSRVFEYQTLLTGGVQDTAESQSARNDIGKGKAKETNEMDVDAEEGDESHPMPVVVKPKKILSQHKVRTSTQDRTLDEMFPAIPSRTSSSKSTPREKDAHSDPSGAPIDVPDETPTPMAILKDKPIEESECFLTSVLGLREEVQKAQHHEFTKIVQEAVFVGIVDLNRCLSLIQHAKRLFLVNHAALAEELFYQLALRQFGNLGHIKLNPPPSLRRLLEIAVDAEDTSSSGIDKPLLVDMLYQKVYSNRELIKEYFNMDITVNGLVESIPRLLRRYTPDLDRLPLFLMRLGPEVNWTDEAECFRTFMRELAYFYIPGPLPSEAPQVNDLGSDVEKLERWQIQHVLFPAMRKYFVTPRKVLDADVVQVASLPDLYRVFERC